MSFTQVPDIVNLLAAIDAGDYKTASARMTAIEQAGGKDFVQLQIIRQWLADSGGGGSGDFVGPGSSTLNAIVRFADTTGKLGEDSVATITDEGDYNSSQFLLKWEPVNGRLYLRNAADTAFGWLRVSELQIGSFTYLEDGFIAAGGFQHTPGLRASAIMGTGGLALGPTDVVAWALTTGYADAAAASIGIFAAGVVKIPGLVTAIRIVTANDTVDSTPGDYNIQGNSSSPITETLVAASANTGRWLSFDNVGTGDMTIDATGLGQIFSISLVNTFVLHTGESLDLLSNGTFWKVK